MSEKVDNWSSDDFKINRIELDRAIKNQGTNDRGCKYYWYAPYEDDFRGGFADYKDDYYSYDPKTKKEYKPKYIRIRSR